MTRYLRIFATLMFGVFCLSGCAISQKTLVQKTDPPRKIAVFFDGTSSDERSDTNVKSCTRWSPYKKEGHCYNLYRRSGGRR